MDHEDLDDPAEDEDQGENPGEDRSAFDRELAAYRARNIAAFLTGKEPVGPYGADPATLLLLDTRDVSGGGTRSTLVFQVVDATGIVVFSSHFTSHRSTWYHDLLEQSGATARRWEQGELVRFEVRAEPIAGPEADALFPAIMRAQPAWGEYGSAQDFPVVRLHRIEPEDPREEAAHVPRLRRLINRWTGSDERNRPWASGPGRPADRPGPQ